MLLHLRTLLITASICTLATPPIAQSFDDGVKAADAGNYDLALEIWKPLAQNGNAKAQANLGVLLAIGMGVQQDTNAALHWLCQAIYQGDDSAQLSIGTLLREGHLVPRDDEAAAYWFLQAAQQGNAIAQASYADLVQTGLSVDKGDATLIPQKICNIGPISHDIATLTIPPFWNGAGLLYTKIEPMSPLFEIRSLETLAWGGKSPVRSEYLDLDTKQISTKDDGEDFKFEPDFTRIINGITQCSLMSYAITFPDYDGDPLNSILENQLLTSGLDTNIHLYSQHDGFQSVAFYGAYENMDIWVWSWLDPAEPETVQGITLRALNNAAVECDIARIIDSLTLNHPNGQNLNALRNSLTNATKLRNISGTVISIDIVRLSEFGMNKPWFLAELKTNIDAFDFSKQGDFNPEFTLAGGQKANLKDIAVVHQIGNAQNGLSNAIHRVFIELVHNCDWDEQTFDLFKSAADYGFSPLSGCR